MKHSGAAFTNASELQWTAAPPDLPTVMQGSFALHLGDTMTAEPPMLEAGGFHYLPAKMHHSAEAKGEAIVQVQGMGPFDIHYLNAAT